MKNRFSLFIAVMCCGLVLNAQSSRPSDLATIKRELLQAGTVAPDAALENANQQPVHLSDFKGKTIILDVWATWCKPCLEKMPALDSLYKKVRNDRVVMLTVCSGDSRDHFVQFMNKNKGRFASTFLFDPGGFHPDSNAFRSRFGINSFPTTMVIDSNGVIRGNGYNEWEISSLLLAAGVDAHTPGIELPELPNGHVGGWNTRLNGKPILDFSMTSPAGVEISNRSLKGRVVLLDFWATWCAPCRILTHELDSAFKDVDTSRLQIVGVNYNESIKAGDPVKYWREHNYRHPMTLNNQRLGDSLHAGNPTVILIDQEGIVRGQWDGWSPTTIGEIRALTNTLIKTGAHFVLQDALDANRAGHYAEALTILEWLSQGGGASQHDITQTMFESLLHLDEPRSVLFAQDWRKQTKDDFDVLSTIGSLISQAHGLTVSSYAYGAQVFEKVIEKAPSGTGNDLLIIYDLTGRCYFLSHDLGRALVYGQKSLDVATKGENISPLTIDYLQGVLKKYQASGGGKARPGGQ